MAALEYTQQSILIPELYQKLKEGFEIVYAKRKSRKGESGLKLFTARWFYKMGITQFCEQPRLTYRGTRYHDTRTARFLQHHLQ